MSVRSTQGLCKACFTPISQQAYTSLRRHNFDFLRCAQHHNTTLHTVVATTKLIFIHINFPCDSLAILCGRKIAVMHARLLQNTQCIRATNVRALTHLFRLQMPQDCRAIIVQSPCASLHGCRKNASNHTTAHEVRTIVALPHLRQSCNAASTSA